MQFVKWGFSNRWKAGDDLTRIAIGYEHLKITSFKKLFCLIPDKDYTPFISFLIKKEIV
jgi:hypothetical protein